MPAVFSLCACIYGRLREKCVVCLSLELQQTECALTHDVDDLYVRVDHGHILIVHGLMSSYRTPLIEALDFSLFQSVKMKGGL